MLGVKKREHRYSYRNNFELSPCCFRCLEFVFGGFLVLRSILFRNASRRSQFAQRPQSITSRHLQRRFELQEIGAGQKLGHDDSFSSRFGTVLRCDLTSPQDLQGWYDCWLETWPGGTYSLKIIGLAGFRRVRVDTIQQGQLRSPMNNSLAYSSSLSPSNFLTL